MDRGELFTARKKIWAGLFKSDKSGVWSSVIALVISLLRKRKSWNLIERLSEDVDLAIDRELLGYSGNPTIWSKTFVGKQSVLGELWSAVRTTLKPPYKVVAHRFIADGEYVAVEASGQNTTPGGKSYNNKYCWVCRISEGMIHELNEYMDTQLVTETFQG
jgi:ketosteroid isomerase-like protein